MQSFSKVWICFMLFFSLCTSPYYAEELPSGTVPGDSTKVDIKITGEVDGQLLDQLSYSLKTTNDKNEDENTSESKGKYIDMSEFNKTELNLTYTDSQNDSQQLDIIYPTVGNAPYKVIVSIHGGGWSTGDRKSSSLKAIQMATQQGYAVVNVGYRLTDEAKWPAQLYDVKAAIRFLRANAREYRLDTRTIVVWGNSAGGHLASMLAATNGMKDMEDLSMGNSRFSSDIQGVVSWYGISDIGKLPDASIGMADSLMGFKVREEVEKAKLASPIYYINKDFPPIFMIHGTNDRVVPFEQSIVFAKKINNVTGKKQASLKLHINAIHSDEQMKSIENVDECLNFIDKIMYPDRKNPYRSRRYKEIKTTSVYPSE